MRRQVAMKLAPSLIKNTEMLVKRLESAVFCKYCVSGCWESYPSIIISVGLHSLAGNLSELKHSLGVRLGVLGSFSYFIEFGDKQYPEIKSTATGTGSGNFQKYT